MISLSEHEMPAKASIPERTFNRAVLSEALDEATEIYRIVRLPIIPTCTVAAITPLTAGPAGARCGEGFDVVDGINRILHSSLNPER